MVNRWVIEHAGVTVALERQEKAMTLQLQNRVATLARLEIYDRMSLRVDRVAPTLESCDQTASGLEVVLSAGSRGIRIRLRLSINNRCELVAQLDPTTIQETRSELYRLFAVDLLPDLMKHDGPAQLLLPLNTGVLVHTAGKPAVSDRFLIYGEQSRWELLPTLPFVSIQTPQGGLVALAAQGAAETECRVSTDGDAAGGGGTVSLGFYFRGRDIDVIERGVREIRYVPLPTGRDIIVFTADVLRRHVTEDLHKPTLTQRASESPEVRYLLQAYIMKLFYGVRAQGFIWGDADSAAANTDGKKAGDFMLTMTFAEAEAGLDRFKSAGVDKVYTQNVGWNLDGHDGAYPTRFPVEERLGGEAGFRHLLAHGHAMGYLMTVHDNYIDGYQVSPDLDRDTLTMDPYGQLQVRGFWGGGTSYLMWPLALGKNQLDDEMKRVKALGVRGPYYLDGMGSPLYPNYHPTHKGPRSDMARGIDRLLRVARDIYGSSATETGFLYCSLTPDLVANPGNDWLLGLCWKEWGITKLIDRCVPLWNLVMSGLVVTENQGLAWPDTMRAMLFNQAPRYEWSTRPGVQQVLDDAMIGKIKFRYDLLIQRFGHLRTQRLVDFKRDGQIDSTTYEDGTVVVGNFATGVLTVNDEPIAAQTDGVRDRRNALTNTLSR